MRWTAGRGISRNKALVVSALVIAAAFGLILGYLLWSYDSFPSEVRKFDSYASVVSSTFNGTEYSFRLKWLSANSVPMYAQLSSPASQTATTDVCDLNLTSVAPGQIIIMPFGLSGPSTSLSQVDLSIAVRSTVNGTEFTIVHHVESVEATPGNIQPQNLTCARSTPPM